MTRILFIINPKSGRKKKICLENLVGKVLPAGVFQTQFRYTEYPGHAETIARDCDADVVVAVGGDGTVNEVARGLAGSEKILGIVPVGSGNGLALHLGYSREPARALRQIAQMNVWRMDCGSICSKPFFCSCGVGLDAEVSAEFVKSGTRGFATYFKDTLSIYSSYKPCSYSLEIDGNGPVQFDAFLVTVGNANQWGNNAYICPAADEADGVLDVTAILPFPVLCLPVLFVRLMSGTLAGSRYVRTFKGKSIIVKRDSEGPAHYDGESCSLGKVIDIEVAPSVLRVIKPSAE